MIDYIIVGFGLAGLSFAEQLEDHKKSFIVYEDGSQLSSRVAGGLYNPVILKRFTSAWKSSEQLKIAVHFYKSLEQKLEESLLIELPVLRRFTSVEEQNLWFEACDKPVLETYLSSELIKNNNKALDIPYHFGGVKYTGRIDVKKMLSLYLRHLEENDRLVKQSFEHTFLEITPDFVVYKGIKARNIVFTEGFGVLNNPLFNYLPLPGNKGEYIIIRSRKLKLRQAVKASIFIIPLGDDLYKIGATYNNNDKTAIITQSAREELERKVQSFMNVDYEIIDQVAGIRPTTRDRKPLLGSHPEYGNVHIFNGLGSRGILAGPYVAEKLYNYIEKKEPLEKEIDCKRFEKLR